MDLLEEVGIAGEAAVQAKVAEKVNNEIKNSNFVVQGRKLGLLTLNPNCTIPQWFGNKKIDESSEKNAYNDLFNYLVEKKIITSNVSFWSFFTADKTYKIDPAIHNMPSLTIDMKDPKISKLLSCYTVKTNELLQFLKDYDINKNYNAKDDETLVFGKGGKRVRRLSKKHRKHKFNYSRVNVKQNKRK